MKVGTKAVGLVVASVIFGGSIGMNVYLYQSAVKVPKLESKVQVLENTVSQQVKENERLMREKFFLNEKLIRSESEVQDLEVKFTQVNHKLGELSQQEENEVDYGEFEITWYNDSGITRSGRHTEDGVTVAVDPKVIPLGTWLKIKFEDGTTLVRRADDTGGAVKGKVVDIYREASTKTLLKFGRQKAEVSILKTEGDEV